MFLKVLLNHKPGIQVVGDHIWRRDIPNATHIGLFPNIVDPYERKAVHVRYR